MSLDEAIRLRAALDGIGCARTHGAQDVRTLCLTAVAIACMKRRGIADAHQHPSLHAMRSTLLHTCYILRHGMPSGFRYMHAHQRTSLHIAERISLHDMHVYGHVQRHGRLQISRSLTQACVEIRVHAMWCCYLDAVVARRF